jgi:hypothetical protein
MSFLGDVTSRSTSPKPSMVSIREKRYLVLLLFLKRRRRRKGRRGTEQDLERIEVGNGKKMTGRTQKIRKSIRLLKAPE